MDMLNSFATGGFSEIMAFVGNFLVLILLAVALFFFAVRAGRALLISLILALYVGFALFTVFPFKDMFLVGDSALARAVAGMVLFGAFTVFPYILLRRVSTTGALSINPISLGLLALATGGFVLALGYHVLDIASVIPLTPSLDALFAPEGYFFWWFLAPLAGIFITTR